MGSSLGAAISRWLGSGDYELNGNTLVTPGSSIPSMHKESQTVVVRHKEFVGTISGSVGFAVQQELVLNPGILGTFPWLYRIAQCYQEYTFRGMVFHYVPTSGVAVSTNPALGAVMLQTSYRSTDSPPTDKMEMLNEYWSTEGSPASSFIHPIECKPVENPFKVQFVRGHTTLTDSPLMYDLGVTYVATQGMPADGNPVGDLWVTYEVELRKPVVSSNVVPPSTMLSYYGQGNCSTVPTTFADFAWRTAPPFSYSYDSGSETITFSNVPVIPYNQRWLLEIIYFGSTITGASGGSPDGTAVAAFEVAEILGGDGPSSVYHYLVKCLNPSSTRGMSFGIHKPVITGTFTKVIVQLVTIPA